MAAINEVLVSLSAATATAERPAFGVGLIIDYQGQRTILQKGDGPSGIVYKSVDRNPSTDITVSVQVDTGFTYTATGSVVDITIPSVDTTVRELIADFTANAPLAVTDIIDLQKTGTGSGPVETHTAETLTNTQYRRIENHLQLQYFYDTDDLAYEYAGIYLNENPSPGIFYFLDAHASTDVAADLDQNYNGGNDWYAILPLTISKLELTVLNDWSSLNRVLLLATGSDSTYLSEIQGSRLAFAITDQIQEFPVVPWAAKKLPSPPGSTTWKFAGPLLGQTTVGFDLSTLLTIRDNRGQAYVRGRAGSYIDGGRINTPDETLYIDQLRSRDWISINAELDLAETLVRSSQENRKIPYTDSGIETLVGVVANRLQNAGELGVIATVDTEEQAGLSFDGLYRYNVEAKSREYIETNQPADIQNRVLSVIEYWYVEAGAIEQVKPVRGRILLTE